MKRRNFLKLTASLALTGCSTPKREPTSPDTDTDTDTDTTTATATDTGTVADTGGSDTGEVCSETSANIEGPFYREEPPARDLLDLYSESGTPVQLEGAVLDQYRPAHIHAKVWIDGAEKLTTQLYFRDDPYLAIDPYVREDLIMDFIARDGARLATFDFVLA
ncbi:MAG: protocatechuate 3,4-dioxygenase beta subunit [Myxococcota bacterium]|jgi:protocatechuate 3,4-dioxygenase beta subunit